MSTFTSTTTLTHRSPQIPSTIPISKPQPFIPPPSTRLRICIDNRWYDLTHWQHSHPGGSEILHHLNNQDASDAFYSIHSVDAIQRLQRMQKTNMSSLVKQGEIAETTKATISFRQFRQELIEEGWFKRSLLWEFFYHSSVYVLAVLGTYFAYWSFPILAIICIGLSMQQAGWIGHDSVHGRGESQLWLGRIMSGSINAFSPTWWSHKHNTHHVYTNYLGIDVDIENDPIFHLFFPDAENDVWFRKYQHLYFIPAASFLYISWRIQSLQHTIKQNNFLELFFISINFLWLYWLGLTISLAAIMLAGALVAVIVTATHQSEEMIVPINPTTHQPYSFVEGQFATTRDARCHWFWMEWLWGGMQYQLEHHLFPTMPKYRYAALTQRVEEWAKQNAIEYRCDDVWQIWQRNFNTLQFFAKESPSITITKQKQ